MGRYRPPAPKSSPYITGDGRIALQEELKQLWKRRADVTRALAAAAAEGDRSENAEYIYRKKELREIDRRIRYLQKRLPELQVVAQKPANREQVFFGAIVQLMDDDEKLVTYRIVGTDEFDREPHYISVDSPLARALLKRELGDEVEVEVPSGRQRYIIADIDYRD